MTVLKTLQFLSLETVRRAAPVVLFLGKDRYWRDRCRQHATSTWVCAPDDPWGIHRLSLLETSIAAILADARTVPMLSPHQLVIAQGLDVLERSGEKERDEASALLAQYLDDPCAFTLLVLEADGLDQRTRLFRLLRDRGLVVELESQEGAGAGTVLEMARAFGCQIDRDAAELLAVLCGDDWSLAEREIAKLGTFVGSRGRITREDVNALVVASERGSVWDLADSLLGGRVKDSLKLVDRLLLSGESGSKLVGGLAWTYRKLIEARELPESISGFQAAQRLRMRPDSAVSLVRRAHKFDRRQAVRGLAVLAEADHQLKSTGVDERTVMEFLVVRLCH